VCYLHTEHPKTLAVDNVTRLFSSADLIPKIENLGKPHIIASNKVEMPIGVEKIRCFFSVITWNLKNDKLIKRTNTFSPETTTSKTITNVICAQRRCVPIESTKTSSKSSSKEHTPWS
jgi:predicted RNase H-like nuclease (RuvC/YqgF family)